VPSSWDTWRGALRGQGIPNARGSATPPELFHWVYVLRQDGACRDGPTQDGTGCRGPPHASTSPATRSLTPRWPGAAQIVGALEPV